MGELLQKIILKAYKVNENTEHTVFVDFSGHVKWIEINIYLNGWKKNKEKDIELIAYLYEDKAIEQLKNILKKLEELEG